MVKKLLVICTLVTLTLAKPPFEGYEPKRISDDSLDYSENNPQCNCKCPTISNNEYDDESTSDSRQKYNYKSPSSKSSKSSLSSLTSGSSSLHSHKPSIVSGVGDDDYQPRPFSKNTESSEEHVVKKETNIIEKEFYTYSPPKDISTVGKTETEQTITNKKKIRVLFIRAPESDVVENVATKIAKSVVEDQTHVYVLTKQVDSSELQKAFEQNIEIKNKKPEIHFVKFKNEEDALDAQRRIQQDIDNQYDGDSSNIEGGEASLQSWTTTNTETSENSNNDGDDSDDSDINDLLSGAGGNSNNGNIGSDASGSGIISSGNNNYDDESDDNQYNSNNNAASHQKSKGGKSYDDNSHGSRINNKNKNRGNTNNKNAGNDKYNLPSRNGYLPPSRNY